MKNNRQGELSPLEIGLHALEHVELDKRGLGASGGGLKGYAEGVGYAANSVSKYRSAAIVYSDFIKANIRFNEESIKANEILLEKTNHLGEIHKAPAECWRVLVELLLSKDWTVAETRKAVLLANSFKIPLHWQQVFLPLSQIVYRAVDTLEFSAKTIERIIEAVNAIESRIATYKTRTAEFIWEFRVWLTAHTGADSWDARKVVEYGRELTAVKEELPHGQFLPWIAAEFEMSDQTAQNFMNVCSRFGQKPNYLVFNPTVLYALSAPSTPESVIDKAIENVSHGTQTLPTTERQARPLTRLEPEVQREVWAAIGSTKIFHFCLFMALDVAFACVYDGQNSTGKPIMKTYTADQAAKILQISEQTCRKWLREGRLPGSETPAGWRLTDDDIDSFLRRCKSRQLNEQDYSRALD